jgi:DNA-binding response OmpR family regulator
MNNNLTKVLFCDAEAVLLAAIEFRFRKHGLEIVAARRRDAAKQMQMQQPRLIVIDAEANPAAALTLLRDIKSQTETLPVIIISPVEDEEALWETLDAGADDFVTKPFKPIELVLRVRRLLK